MKYCLEVFLFGEGLAGCAWKVGNVRTQPKEMSRRQGQEHWPESFDTACVIYCYNHEEVIEPVVGVVVAVAEPLTVLKLSSINLSW